MKQKLRSIPLSSILITVIGIVTGLVIGFLISIPIDKLPFDWSWAVSVGAYVVAVILMTTIFILRRDLIMESLGKIWPVKTEVDGRTKVDLTAKSDEVMVHNEDQDIDWDYALLLDTSAIIDGRVADIASTGFLSGEFVVPSFILEELQKIADSASQAKRNRGRRGLEILEELKKEEFQPFHVINHSLPKFQPVDSALVDLAAKKKAKIVTTDYGLNKIGKVRGVCILNINELANMVKTILVPGEEITVEVIQKGKESGQGVAYLPDGTMIVVENGEEIVGQKIEVVVERLFQTEAGRMIFVKPKQEN